jgi:hypothetical protein
VSETKLFSSFMVSVAADMGIRMKIAIANWSGMRTTSPSPKNRSPKIFHLRSRTFPSPSTERDAYRLLPARWLHRVR